MSLTTPVSGGTIYATDVSQLVNVLQQPSGGSEVITAALVQVGAFQTGSTVSQWFTTRSQGSTPSSATTGSTTLAGVTSISTSSLGSSGVNVGGGASGPSNTSRFTTTITINY